MSVYNYAAYAKVFSKGVVAPNMTKIAKILFEPIISLGECVTRKNVPYVINSKYAALWYKQESDIPGNLKKAADNAKVYKAIGKYFDKKVLDNFLSGVKVDDMMSELLTLIKESDLSETQKRECKIVCVNRLLY